MVPRLLRHFSRTWGGGSRQLALMAALNSVRVDSRFVLKTMLYRRPLREAATQTLAKALRERTPDDLGDLIVMLHEEDRLCVDDSDLEEDDLRIVCSLGLKSER